MLSTVLIITFLASGTALGWGLRGIWERRMELPKRPTVWRFGLASLPAAPITVCRVLDRRGKTWAEVVYVPGGVGVDTYNGGGE